MAEKEDRLAELAFSLQYEGPALASHEMDVKRLAPALFAVGELFQELNRVQYPDNPDLAVNLKATRDGSVDVQLALVLGAAVGKMLVSPETTALANLTTLLGGFGRLVDFIKVRAGMRIKSVEPTKPGKVRVKLENDVEVEIDQTTKAFEENPTIRHSLREVVTPVGEQEGINAVRVRSVDQKITIGVEKAEVPAFLAMPEEAPLESEEVTNQTRNMALRVVSPWFKKGNKWKVTDGPNEFWVSVLDEGFLADVLAARVAITPHDVLQCRVRIRQRLDSAGTLHTEYEVLSVTQHQQRPQRELGES